MSSTVVSGEVEMVASSEELPLPLPPLPLLLLLLPLVLLLLPLLPLLRLWSEADLTSWPTFWQPLLLPVFWVAFNVLDRLFVGDVEVDLLRNRLAVAAPAPLALELEWELLLLLLLQLLRLLLMDFFEELELTEEAGEADDELWPRITAVCCCCWCCCCWSVFVASLVSMVMGMTLVATSWWCFCWASCWCWCCRCCCCWCCLEVAPPPAEPWNQLGKLPLSVSIRSWSSVKRHDAGAPSTLCVDSVKGKSK